MATIPGSQRLLNLTGTTVATTATVQAGTLLIGSGVTAGGKVTSVTAGTANTDAVNLQQLNNATTGVLVYIGTWNANTNTPSLSSGVGTVGQYYIVSVDGTTLLDGINDWKVGDWAVFSDQATDAWQKIDNTSILGGAGTGGNLAAWSGSGTTLTLENAPATFSGNNTTFANFVSVTGGKVNLGADVSIFRDGANILRTDDKLHANNDIYLGGAGKIFDRANNSNYIELADTIVFSTAAEFDSSLNTQGTVNIGNGQIILGATGRIQGIDTVSAATDATSKTYVDNAVSGVSSGVTSVATTNGITGGTITSTGTIQVDSTVVRTTGTQSIAGAKTFTNELLFDASFKSDSILLSGSQNFDNISRGGFYNLYNTSSGSTNSPPFTYGTMIVVGGNKQNSSFGFQMANERLGNGLYIRGMNDTASAWSSWAEVWTSTTDGAGSGLDADKLDGQQGSYYAPATGGNYLPLAGGTMTGNLFMDNATITIDPDVAGAVLTWRESDSSTIAGQLRGYANRGDIYLYKDGVKTTELSALTDSFIPALHIGGTAAATGGVLQTTGDVNIDGNADISGNVTVLTGSSSGSLTVGRNAQENIVINVSDNTNSITANQDSDGNGPHNFVLDRVFSGTGANDFRIRLGGTDQLVINKLNVATFSGLVSGVTPVSPANFATKAYVDTQDLNKTGIWFQTPGKANTNSPRNDGFYSNKTIKYTTFQANFTNLSLLSGSTYYLVISRFKKGQGDAYDRTSQRASGYKIMTNVNNMDQPYRARPLKIQITSSSQNFDFRPDLYFSAGVRGFPRPSGYNAPSSNRVTSKQNFAFRIEKVTSGTTVLSDVLARLQLQGDKSNSSSTLIASWKPYQ